MAVYENIDSESFLRHERTNALFKSILKKKNAIVIHNLIKQGVNIDAKDPKGHTPLLLAGRHGLKAVVNLLLGCGGKVNSSECPCRRTLLHYASGYGWTEIVHFLVKREPDLSSIVYRDAVPCQESIPPNIHAKDKNGRTALHFAALCGHPQIVKCLVEEGANLLLKTESGKTALHDASTRGHLEVVKLLIEKGAILDTRDKYGNTALHEASSKGHLEVVQFLLEKGANMELKTEKGETALLRAFQKISIDVIVFLINSGANVNCCNCNESTVLHYASRVGWLELVQYLVKRVPVSDFILDQDSRDKDSCTANTCPTIHAIDMDGRTALNVASYFGHIEIVKFLVAEGASLNVRNTFGKTALYETSSIGRLEAVKYLVEAGADMNLKCIYNNTPLLIAAYSGRKDTVEFLVNSGAHLDDFDQDKNTVLHYAIEKRWTCLVQYLVKRMSELDARNGYGETALLEACRTGQFQSAKYLLQAGARSDIGNNGYLPFSYIKKFAVKGLYVKPCAELINLFVETGVYLKPVDYYDILNNSSLKLHLLQDVKFCSRAIVNKYNAHDLPALYELPVSASLPRIERIVIVSNSEVAQAIKRSVELEIQKSGHCNVLEVRPMALSLFCVKSILEYYDKKNQFCIKD